MNISIIETRTVPTVQVEVSGIKRIFHSKYDPLREVEGWVKRVIEDIIPDQPILIIGLAAGYHIEQLATKYPEQKISVIEINKDYADWFLTSSFYDRIHSLTNVSIVSLNDNSLENLLATIHQNNILIQNTSLDIIPAQLNSIQSLLKDFQMQKDSIKQQLGNMLTNFKKNVALRDQGIKDLKNKYENKKMILVSAGPSLDKQLPFLKKIKKDGKITIASVGTAVKALIKAEIIPDLIMIIDPNEGTRPQLENVSLPEIPLLYLSTAYHDTIMLHQGPRRIVWQEGFEEAEEMALGYGDPLIKTGGSVATALLDTLIYLGASAVALVGQDLAYTNGQTHASNTPSRTSMGGNERLQTVLNFDQTGEVQTANNLSIYRKWLERYAQTEKKVKLYNCTEGGAFIKGWQHIRLKEFINLDHLQ